MEITHLAYLSIGSNLGNRLENLQYAINEITKAAGKVTAVSSVYETEPIGFESCDWFLNACLSLETSKTPFELLAILNDIERESGRKPKKSDTYESRTLDIDIIFFDQQIIESHTLHIPHSRFRERLFVLLPLNDLDKDFIDPFTSLTIEKLLLMCRQEGVLRKLNLSLLI